MCKHFTSLNLTRTIAEGPLQDGNRAVKVRRRLNYRRVTVLKPGSLEGSASALPGIAKQCPPLACPIQACGAPHRRNVCPQLVKAPQRMVAATDMRRVRMRRIAPRLVTAGLILSVSIAVVGCASMSTPGARPVPS